MSMLICVDMLLIDRFKIEPIKSLQSLFGESFSDLQINCRTLVFAHDLPHRKHYAVIWGEKKECKFLFNCSILEKII